MVLKVTGLEKSYRQGDGSILPVLKGIDFSLEKGGQVAVMGESGSGKTTLLNCFTGLDNFNSGSVYISGTDIGLLNDRKLSRFRNKNLGFVFQFHYLLKDFTVKENVMMPCLIDGQSQREAEEKAVKIISKLRLSHRMNYAPSQLSGGEQQRVAIARSIVMNPLLLAMDEPTGNLDEWLANESMNYIVSICREGGISLVIATHNRNIARKMDSIYFLKDGRLQKDSG
ncbi:MAG: ABC transporter ATP-binding protein [Oligoflexia bacterium]|nr:ABC transporter ATP-binding protein [Oligoflexia bacterium]